MARREAKARMPISATGNNRPARDAGFSLVEAMTALMIVGLMAGAVLLLAPGADHKTRTAAERLAARVAAASEESIVVNRPLALLVTRDGYGFERLEEHGWSPEAPNSPLGFRAWEDDIEARVEVAANGPDDARVARFDAMGGATPAAIVLEGGGARWRVSIDGEGDAHVARAE